MTAMLQPDIEAVASDFCDLEELVTERLHEIHKTYGLDTLRDVADRPRVLQLVTLKRHYNVRNAPTFDGLSVE
jgi:hypothetical protein